MMTSIRTDENADCKSVLCRVEEPGSIWLHAEANGVMTSSVQLSQRQLTQLHIGLSAIIKELGIDE